MCVCVRVCVCKKKRIFINLAKKKKTEKETILDYFISNLIIYNSTHANVNPVFVKNIPDIINTHTGQEKNRGSNRTCVCVPVQTDVS